MPNQTHKTVQILYFASLAEQAKLDKEYITVDDTTTLTDLYSILKENHSFTVSKDMLSVAINHHIANWQDNFTHKDIIAFIPPVAGG